MHLRNMPDFLPVPDNVQRRYVGNDGYVRGQLMHSRSRFDRELFGDNGLLSDFDPSAYASPAAAKAAAFKVLASKKAQVISKGAKWGVPALLNYKVCIVESEKDSDLWKFRSIRKQGPGKFQMPSLLLQAPALQQGIPQINGGFSTRWPGNEQAVLGPFVATEFTPYEDWHPCEEPMHLNLTRPENHVLHGFTELFQICEGVLHLLLGIGRHTVSFPMRNARYDGRKEDGGQMVAVHQAIAAKRKSKKANWKG